MTDDQNLIISKKQLPHGEDGYRVFSVRLKDDLVISLDELARQSGHSRNALINMLLAYALARAEVE